MAVVTAVWYDGNENRLDAVDVPEFSADEGYDLQGHVTAMKRALGEIYPGVADYDVLLTIRGDYTRDLFLIPDDYR